MGAIGQRDDESAVQQIVFAQNQATVAADHGTNEFAVGGHYVVTGIRPVRGVFKPCDDGAHRALDHQVTGISEVGRSLDFEAETGSGGFENV